MSRLDKFEKKSFTNNSPSKFNLQWSNTEKTFKVYDKDEKTTTLASLPSKFILIDNFVKITGWCNETQSSFYSNEVTYTTKEILTVKNKNGVVITGLYADIKGQLKDLGAKYSESIYVLLENGKMANITLVGDNTSVWQTFKTDNKTTVARNWFGAGNPQKKTRGAISWYVPEYRIITPLTEAEMKLADEAYNSLEEYKNGLTQTTETETTTTDTNVENLIQSTRLTATLVENDDDTNDSDLPWE